MKPASVSAAKLIYRSGKAVASSDSGQVGQCAHLDRLLRKQIRSLEPKISFAIASNTLEESADMIYSILHSSCSVLETVFCVTIPKSVKDGLERRAGMRPVHQSQRAMGQQISCGVKIVDHSHSCQIEPMTFAPLKNDLILRAAKGEKVERPPVWIMRQAGRYLPEYHKVKGKRDFFETCRDAEIAAEITIQPVDHYDGLIDAAIIFSDILVIPQAMGFEIEMVEGKGPVFVDPLRSQADLKRVVIKPDILKELGWAFKAITLTRTKLNGRVPLLGFCGAPWTLLVYMTEGQGSKMFRFAKQWIYEYTKDSHALLQAITDACIEFLAQQVVAGAQMLQVFESWAGELGPNEFNEFCLPYLRQIAQKLPSRLAELGVSEKIPLTVFAKGAWYALDDLCESGYDTVSLDWLYKPEDAVKIANGRRITLQGNLDPGIMYGSDEVISQKVEQMIKGFGGGKQNYIINFGHGTHPFMSPEKVGHFLKECHRFGSL